MSCRYPAAMGLLGNRPVWSGRLDIYLLWHWGLIQLPQWWSNNGGDA
jgi:hypothetical protein